MAEGTNPNAEQQPNETDTEATSQTDQSAEAKTNDESANKPADKEAEAKTKDDSVDKETKAETKDDSVDKETKAETKDDSAKSKDKEAEAETKDDSVDKETKAKTNDESAKSADKEAKAKAAKAKAAKAKSDGKGGGKAKKPSPEDKPFPEFIEQEFIPALKEAFTQQGIEDMKLNFVKEKLSITGASADEPCWQVIGKWQHGQRQFNLYFLDEDIKGQKAFSHATSGSQPSTIESFMIDERRVNLDLLVLYTLQRLNGQKWLVRN